MKWTTLGAVAPDALVEARVSLHHAAQVIASVGMTYLEPKADDSHPNMGWNAELASLVGRRLPGEGVSVGLHVGDLSLRLVGPRGERLDSLALDGRTLDDALDWGHAAVASSGATPIGSGIVRSSYEIPAHPVGSGAVFSAERRDAFAELARWFAIGHEILSDIAQRAGAPEVRCWPHHFDLGSLIVVDAEPDGSLKQSIGIGLSAGDDSYREPYWYVSPWPYPDPDVLRPLTSSGHWHTEGFTAAILTGSELIAGGAEKQSARIRAWFAEAMNESRAVLAQ